MPPLSGRLARSIRLAHVKQLAQLEVPPPEDIPRQLPPPYLLSDTIDWITANPRALKAAQDTQCTSSAPTSPNWDAVFFSLMESSAMYQRKVEEMIKAIIAARSGNFDIALTHLEAAQEDIDTIAKKLDCTFIQLCDFSKEGPDGTWWHSGAFAGLFISNSAEKPFMGVAFKGSNSFRDGVTDLDWDPIAPLIPDVAWGAKVHRGFYLGLFGQFQAENNTFQVPFDLLAEQLSASYSHNARLHFTGHSLGGAYCTLTYGEFLRRQASPPFNQYNFGDMYSLAAPRTCLEPFADQVNKLTTAGGGKYLFRVVNNDDPVPTIPPRTASQLVDYPFIHVAGAWNLTVDGPVKMGDEPPPVDPQSIADIIWNSPNHKLSDYYANWQNTPHN